MLLEDIIVGRKIEVQAKPITFTTTITGLIGASPKRVLLIFGNSTQTVFLHTDPELPLTTGVRQVAGGSPIILPISEWGNALIKTWFVKGDTAGGTIMVWQGFYDG